MSYKEHISSLLQQETVDGNNAPETVMDQVQRNENGMTDDAAKTSFNAFLNDVVSTPPAPEAEIHVESKAERYARKFAEVVTPVVAGVGAKVAAESAMYAGGPLIGAAVAGISGMASGAASAAMEMGSVKKTGEGAKEFYSQKVLQREFEREEAKQATGLGGVVKSAWVAVKDYSNAAKLWALESGFKVKDRNVLIDNILLANNIDPTKPFYDQLERVNGNDLRDLVKQLEVQSVLSGFAEKKTLDEITKRVDLLVSANAALQKKIMDPTQAEAALEAVWAEAQQEISNIIGHTRMKYILTGAVDRGAKSAVYTLLMGGAIDSLRNLWSHKDGVLESANLTGSHSEAFNQVDGALKVNDHNLDIVDSLKESAQVEVDDKSRLLNMAEEQFNFGSHQESVGLPDKLKEIFGDNYENYIEGGGEGPGSRIDRLNVLQNFKDELERRPDLKNVVERLAQTRGWKPTDMWRAILMRAQYENGVEAGALARILEQIQNGTFRGDLDQGLSAAGQTGEGWTKLVEWAINPEASTTSPSLGNLGPMNAETLNRMRQELEQAQIKLNIFNDESARLTMEKVSLIQQALKVVVSESAGNMAETAGRNANLIAKQIAHMSTLFGAIATVAAEVEAEGDTGNINLRRRSPANRRTNQANQNRGPNPTPNRRQGPPRNSNANANTNRTNSSRSTSQGANQSSRSRQTNTGQAQGQGARPNSSSRTTNNNSSSTNSGSGRANPNAGNGSANTNTNNSGAGPRSYQRNTGGNGGPTPNANPNTNNGFRQPPPSGDRATSGDANAEPKRKSKFSEEPYNPLRDTSGDTNWTQLTSDNSRYSSTVIIPNFYRILDVGPSASEKEVRDAYIRARRLLDVPASTGDADAQAKLLQITEAHRVLTKARKAYHNDYQAKYQNRRAAA